MLEIKCKVCGLSVNFAGYHLVGTDQISLCMACATMDVEAYRITIPGESGFIEKSLGDAMTAMESLVEEMDIDDEPYIIKKILIKRLELENLPEFTGF